MDDSKFIQLAPSSAAVSSQEAQTREGSYRAQISQHTVTAPAVLSSAHVAGTVKNLEGHADTASEQKFVCCPCCLNDVHACVDEAVGASHFDRVQRDGAARRQAAC